MHWGLWGPRGLTQAQGWGCLGKGLVVGVHQGSLAEERQARVVEALPQGPLHLVCLERQAPVAGVAQHWAVVHWTHQVEEAPRLQDQALGWQQESEQHWPPLQFGQWREPLQGQAQGQTLGEGLRVPWGAEDHEVQESWKWQAQQPPLQGWVAQGYWVGAGHRRSRQGEGGPVLRPRLAGR